MEYKSLDKPDERRGFPKGSMEIVTVGGITVGRGTFEPGWRWTECMSPIVGTERCMLHHDGLVLSGRIHIEEADGTAADLDAGDVFVLEPDHDAWVLGDEPCVMVDYSPDIAKYARKA